MKEAASDSAAIDHNKPFGFYRTKQPAPFGGEATSMALQVARDDVNERAAGAGEQAGQLRRRKPSVNSLRSE